MPTRVTRYRCSVCGSLLELEGDALVCEASPVVGDDFKTGDELWKGRDQFRVVDRRVRRMSTANGRAYHMAVFQVEGPYTWQGKPRLVSAKYLHRLGLALRSAARD